MKYVFAILILVFPLLISSACDSETLVPDSNLHNNGDSMSTNINIKAGNQVFQARLLNNDSADAFKAMLPLSVIMTELNGNEKYYRLALNLPTKASNPGTINAGDLMLWGSNTLVIFYESFSTSYSYTKLGKINDPTGLANAGHR